MSNSVLAVFAHPDDAEMAAGATLAKWAAEERDVHLLILTNGDRGSPEPHVDRAQLARVRAGEQAGAAKVLGLTDLRILDNPDGELENNEGVRLEIAREVRRIRPATLVTCDPETWVLGKSLYYYNHPDHRVAGAAALDTVCYGAGNWQFFRDLLEEGLEPWSVREMLLAWTNAPNHYQDVTGFVERNMAALAEHHTQVDAGQYGDFRAWMPKVAEKNGRRIGATHAEAFRHLVMR